jgi:hypothetical protein
MSMTAAPTLPREAMTSKPGWTIAANLTPPEMVASHRLRRLRRKIVLLVCLVALVAAGGYAYAYWQVRTADTGLKDVQAQTAGLHQAGTQFGSVTQLQGSVAQVQRQLAALMAGDVDVAALVGRIQDVRPSSVAISQLTVTLTTPKAVRAGAAQPGSLDNSGRPHIGAITIAATGAQITDAAAYSTSLAAVPGVVDVVPTSNATQASGTKFTIALSVTDAVLSHRFTAAPTAGK